MNWIKEIRERTGLSQYKLSLYLGVSRSLIGHSELNTRTLPTDAVLKLMALTKTWDEAIEKIRTDKGSSADSKYEASEEKQRERAITGYTRKLSDYNYKLILLQRRLQEMKKNYQQSQSLLDTTATLLNNLPAGTERSIEKLGLEIVQMDASMRLRKHGETNQLVLGLEIDELQGRINTCEIILKEMKK